MYPDQKSTLDTVHLGAIEALEEPLHSSPETTSGVDSESQGERLLLSRYGPSSPCPSLVGITSG